MEDITIKCKDCGEEFTFSAEEQEFYKSKGFQQPIRCKSCRRIKKIKFQNRQNNANKYH